MSVHESNLTTQDVLNDETFENTLKKSRPSISERSESFQTKENTRRNSLSPKDVLPESFINSPPPTAAMSEPCQRCSGDGEVAKPCRFCKATGKTSRTASCVDCEAEKNGCGNMNCNTCHGVGRIVEHCACRSCRGSGSGLKLTCGDCGGSGHTTPETSRNGSEIGCDTIQE